LKEAATLLELALWKAKLRQKKEEASFDTRTKAKKAKIDVESVRQEKRVTCGADNIIKNVLPFLKLHQLEEIGFRLGEVCVGATIWSAKVEDKSVPEGDEEQRVEHRVN